MPSGERRARDRADLRERIIAVALTVLEAEGTAALTVRRVASDLDYTAPIVYQHFANKDALVLELINHGYRLLLAEFERVLHEPDIDRRLLQVATAYIHFAGVHPHLFEVMNGTAVPAEQRRGAAEPVLHILLELLTTWSAAHDVALPDCNEACEIIWGTMYGIASIGRLDTVGNVRAQRLATEALSATLRGWRSP